MQTRRRQTFTTIRTEGALLSPDFLAWIAAGGKNLNGMTPGSYGLKGEGLNEQINRSWNRIVGAWTVFQHVIERTPPSASKTGITRERWLLPLFAELGYERLMSSKAIEIDDKSYPVSHMWANNPIHLVGYDIDLDRRTPGVVGASRTSPHTMMQTLLNRSKDYMWGLLSNGRQLRILRDNASLTRQAYVEFDLEAMMRGEVYADFSLLWLLCHRSRLEADQSEACWLERWSHIAQEQGVRVLDSLRDSVQRAIEHLGAGFLAHPTNQVLRRRLQSGVLSTQDYFTEILRLVYRLMFLFVAEERNLLPDPNATVQARQYYTEYYSTTHLRQLAERISGSKHSDLFYALRVVIESLGADGGCPELALPALGGSMFSIGSINDIISCEIANHTLLDAIRSLAFTFDGHLHRPVDYRNLGPEELGSVYESLLELVPEITADAGAFNLKSSGSGERKTTGSYYTPSSLITCLLNTTLDPLIDEAARQPNAETALLKLKICDPACGSGHFLIAAAHRVAQRLASIRIADETPSPTAMNAALHDVIDNCIYGVDLNPMAVELCKINLWIEAFQPDKPLAFLDRRILVGDSLFGATPKALESGIPDSALQAIHGDDKKVVSKLHKRNKNERSERLRLNKNSHLSPTSLEHERLLADTWCASFVWPKILGAPVPITDGVFWELGRKANSMSTTAEKMVGDLSLQYRFFHWHLAFPDVFSMPAKGESVENTTAGWNGGFDCVVSNPPWGLLKFDEREFFARHDPSRPEENRPISGTTLQRLEKSNPTLYQLYIDGMRQTEAIQHFIHNSGVYPLTGTGGLNSSALFSENAQHIQGTRGHVGLILPTAIATDASNEVFFQYLITTQRIVSLYDFENREGMFSSVDSRTKFCLLTLTGSARPSQNGAQFVFYAHSIADLDDPDRQFSLSSDEIKLVNPNTLTCPIFRSKRDIEIIKSIYARVPVLADDTKEQNSWQISIKSMVGLEDPRWWHPQEYFTAHGWTLTQGQFTRQEERYLPLYEGRMVDFYDHRVASVGINTKNKFRSGIKIETELAQHINADFVPLPRHWVSEKKVIQTTKAITWRKWLIAFKDVTSPTNVRTLIASIIPSVGANGTLRLVQFADTYSYQHIVAILSNINSFVVDYIARQKVGGNHMTTGHMKQLPFLPPEHYSLDDFRFIVPRVLELTYTASDLQPFSQDVGYDGPPFIWDENRRFLIRCELDALYFHLYDIARDDVDYIMETFPIVKRRDEAAHGEYRTKRVILEMYDEMANGVENYVTLLDPPPADPRVAHLAWGS